MDNMVITIGRQFGSGGRDIGRKLADKLNIPFYDKELILLAAKESEISPEILKNVDEKKPDYWSYTASVSSVYDGSIASYNLPMTDKLFIAQSSVIKKLAEKGPCVIVGRCADYILNEYNKCINLFIYSDIESRIDRCINVYGISKDRPKETILKTDKKRAAYYNFYTGQEWGNLNNYHLSVNSATIGIDGCVELITSFVKMAGK